MLVKAGLVARARRAEHESFRVVGHGVRQLQEHTVVGMMTHDVVPELANRSTK